MFKKNGYEIIRSDRKSVSIEIKRDSRVVVRAPKNMHYRDIEHLISLRQDWIEKNLKKLQSEQELSSSENLTHEEIENLRKLARTDLTERAVYYSEIMGVKFGRISIKTQKTLWGSCSGQGNLNFNCILMLCPEEVRNYVVIHELCHLREMNHSKNFWNLVEKYCPDYKAHRAWLKNEGKNIIAKIR